MTQYIEQSIKDSIALKEQLLASNEDMATINEVSHKIATLFKQGGKVLLCGNGGSASDAQHIAAEFVGRFVAARHALPAIALTTDTSILTAVGNDFGFDTIFERQVEALGCSGDLLIGISTSGNSANVIKALTKANAKGLTTFGLLGGSGGVCLPLCDSAIIVGSPEAARVQELHILIGHILCGASEQLICKDE
ncbi:MAG: D-sedoheptulose 7-phosphate isomerase [Rikenellaceae bacterium]